MSQRAFWISGVGSVFSALLATLVLSLGPASVTLAANTTEEIKVTARRKSESLQEVPLAVTAISSDAIQKRGIDRLEGIIALDPSIVVDQGFSAEDTRIAIRGLSNTRGKSNVAFLVDGVDVTSESTLSAGSSLLVSQRLLGDVERIEIIKGPQSALYGRSAFAGALSYVTKNANLSEVEGNFGLQYSEYDRYQLSGSLSGPVVKDTLGARLQLLKFGGDGYYDNAASGRNLGGPDGWGTALTINWEPSERTDLKWRTAYSDEQSGAQPQIVFRGDELVEVPIPPQAFESNGGPVEDGTQVFGKTSFGKADGRQVFASENPVTGEENIGADTRILRSSLQINHQIGPGTLTSTTGYTDAKFTITQDVDYQGAGFPDTIPNNFQTDSLNDTTQLTQEFRYATELDGAFNYTGGILGWMEDRDALGRSYIATCAFNNPLCDSGGWQEVVRLNQLKYGDNGFVYTETVHWSLYGLVEWGLTDKLTLSAEARWVNESFEVDRTTGTLCLLTPFAIPGCTSVDAPNVRVMGTVRSNYVTPKFLAEYTLNDTAMLYASIGKGQKPGGISTLPSGGTQALKSLTFDSEKLWAYEAGWKTTFDGGFGNLVFNGALFFQDYTDKQVLVNIFDPVFGIIPSVANASSAEVFGQEVQLVYMPPIEGLTINVAYTHLDPEFVDYVAEVTSARTIAEDGQCTVATSSTGSGETVCRVDRSDNQLELSPENTFTSTIGYSRPLLDTGMDFLVEVDANYTGDRYVNSSNFSVLESYWLANIRLGLNTDKWNAIFYVDNIFDDDTIKSGGAAAPDFGAGFSIPPTIVNSSQLPIPRVTGVRFNVNFGD